jgi:hypothetical protein
MPCKDPNCHRHCGRIWGRLTSATHALNTLLLRLLLPGPVGWLAGLLGVAALALACGAADARVGGGHSFSGGRRGGGGGGFGGGGYGGGGGGGGDLIWLLFRYPAIGIPVLLIVVAFILYSAYQKSRMPGSYSSGDAYDPDLYTPPVNLRLGSGGVTPAAFDRLRQFDANFSEISFTDFIYALYARAHEARGRGNLNDFSSYLSPAALGALQPVPPAVRQVTGVIVGGTEIISVSDPDAAPEVAIRIRYEANYTEVDAAGKEQSYYVVEQWSFTRRRDVLSPAPEQVTALHCPRCGGALDKRPDGSCAYCGVKITGGDFAWYVNEADLLVREARGPLLTQDVPEEGTDLPTVYQPDFQVARARFMRDNPAFSWPRTEERFRHIFLQLQEAWSSLRWERARPYETDNIFQMHRYWIEAYRRQAMRNVLEDVTIEEVIPVKVSSDQFYDALTARIFANMLDYTVDAQGKVVTGSRNRKRRFSEYWTFIRRRGVQENEKPAANCPNCGAPLDNVNMAGTCQYCGGKITSGNFDWVLSRIEQDEAYNG